ncbi:MAG: hypothetical protein K1X91_02685 [Bacteriodetes bacterium]|nr:hypothetical protein [Bacteroidota bacterium]
MRTVTVNHKDDRGTVDYVIYENITKDISITVKSIVDVLPGEYVQSDNGWIVPLISRSVIQDKFLRGSNKTKLRKTPFQYEVFNFPKDRKVFRTDKLDTAVFNYTPKHYNGIAGNDKQCRLYELSSRKMLWVQLVSNGVEPEATTRKVYPSERNIKSLTKQLIANPKIISLLITQDTTLRSELVNRGITLELIADEITKILHDESGSITQKRWALDTVISAFSDESCG